MSNTGDFKRDLLIQKAAEIFAEKGYRAATLEMIAQSLDMTKPALYYYVKSKKQILLEIFDEILNIYLNSAASIEAQNLSPIERMEALIRAHTKAVLSNQSFTKIFHQEKAELDDQEIADIKGKMRRYEHYFIKTYKEGIDHGYFKSVDERILIKGILGMINWTYHWYKEDGLYTQKDISDIYLKILLDGYIETND